MARIRTIKPEAFDDEDLSALPFSHRWGFVGLWTQADKAGRFEDRPRRLKARIFPFDDIDMNVVLTDLARAGFIIRYVVDGKPYGCIKPSSWAKHQRPRPDETESILPPVDTANVFVASTDDSDESVPVECLGKERKGREERGEEEGDGGDSVEPLSRSTPSADDSPVLLSFPAVGTGPKEWHLTTRQLEDWRLLHPGLDVLAEAQQALAWVIANPGRRKTTRGMPGFLVNWFNRSVNQGGGRRARESERPASDHEIKQYENWRRAMGGCGHSERCADRAECLGRFVARLRGTAA